MDRRDPFRKSLPIELFGVIAEFLHAQRYYGTLANLNEASERLYDQTLRLLWTAVTFRTPRNVDARVAERERVEKFAQILNAGGTELIQYIMDTNHSPQLEDTEEDAIKYWSFVKNRLEASPARPRSLKAVGESFCAHSSIDAVRFILLAGFTWGSDDMATLAEHLAVFYASGSDHCGPRHLRILLDDCTPSRDNPAHVAFNRLIPAPLQTKGISISNMNGRTLGKATSRSMFYDVLKLLHGYVVGSKPGELRNQSASYLFARSFRTSDVKAMLDAHKEAIEYDPRFACCHLQFILCDLSPPEELMGIADILLETYIKYSETWASDIPAPNPFSFLRLRRKSGVAVLEILFDPLDKAIVVLTSGGNGQAASREVHPVVSIGRE